MQEWELLIVQLLPTSPSCMYLASSFLRLLRVRAEAISSLITSTHHNLGLPQTLGRKDFLFPAVKCHIISPTLWHFALRLGLGQPWRQDNALPSPVVLGGCSIHTRISFAKVDFGVEATENQINKSHLGKGEKNNPPTRYHTREGAWAD